MTPRTGAVVGLAAGFALFVTPAWAADQCVGSGAGCLSSVQAAVDAARGGDTVTVGPGTFAGPVTITKSLTLAGAGANRTTIRGGGPVLTIGEFGETSRPTVAIRGVKVTGGRTSSSWDAVSPDSRSTFLARGGGIHIPPGEDFKPGATVSITDSAIVGNRAEPATTFTPEPDDVPPDWPLCAGTPCAFALAEGGGINSWGALTLTDTLVSGNTAGGARASDADGGGIFANLGALRLVRSRVVGNRATVAAPNGRFAEGAGIFVAQGSLAMVDSLVAGNRAQLTSTFDLSVEMNANSGGVHIGDAPALIERSRITGNGVKVVDPVGQPLAFDSALLADGGLLTMRDSQVTGNTVLGVVASSDEPGPGGSAMEVDGGGTIQGTVIANNTSVIRSPGGDAGVAGTLAVFNFSGGPARPLNVSDTTISGNLARAQAPGGSFAVGGGVFNNSTLNLVRVAVRGNTARAGDSAQGGGIWNGSFLSGPSDLRLVDTTVTGNAAVAADPAGGGVFTSEPFERIRTTIAGNRPDDLVSVAPAAVRQVVPYNRSPASPRPGRM